MKWTRWIALLASAGFHLLLTIFLLLEVRSKPSDTGDPPLGAVELLMVEKKGSSEPSAANPPPAGPSPPSETHASNAGSEQAPPPPDHAFTSADELVPAATQPSPEAPKAARSADPDPANPQTARTEEAPVFHLEGTDSESNAIALGDQVLAASPDDKFRNRPPIYPEEAAALGQHGAVLVVIHISEYGLPTEADVVASSGVESLDRASLDAVRRWHFRPAIKDGRPVPSILRMRFVFNSE